MAYSIALAYVAGVLSTLSPCVIPILPLIFSGTGTHHKSGAIVIASGIVFSFTLITILFSLFGALLPLDVSQLRAPSAILLIFFGGALLAPQYNFKLPSFDRTTNFLMRMLSKITPEGISGQFITGSLLGAIWLPCSGPTLGAASILAAQSQHVLEAATVIFSFSLGAVTPLVILGVLWKNLLDKLKAPLKKYVCGFNSVFGLTLILLGAAIVTNYDRVIEQNVAYFWPDLLIRLSLKY